MSGVQKIIVADEDTDQRLDRWLRRLFPHVSQGRIEKMCRKGDLRVDSGRVKPSTRVMAGQTVRVPPLPAVDHRPNDMVRRISDADIKMIQSCVIYRDDHVIALNKPHGLAVQGGSGQSRHVDGLAEALRFGMDDKPKLVHRLDKDTSGVLLLARDRLSAKALTAAFRHRETQKIYWAVVAGVPHPKIGMIKTGLVKAFGHGKNGEGEKMYNVHPRDIDDTPGAKKAVTDYVMLEAAGRRSAMARMARVRRCITCTRATSTTLRGPRRQLPIMLCLRPRAGARPGWRYIRSLAAPTSCVPIWASWVIRLLAMANTAARGRKTWATVGGHSWAVTFRKSCTYMRAR